jgi:hypothetical protein
MKAADDKLSLVDEVMIEFGSLTCADVSLESVHIVHVETDNANESSSLGNTDMSAKDPADYVTINKLWSFYRRTPPMVEKYGAVVTTGGGNGSVNVRGTGELTDAETALYKKLCVAFDCFVNKDTDPTQPLYLCICKESGDEFLIRRALPNDKFTSGKFMMLNCEYSKMSDGSPRNKLKAVRESSGTEGEYLLCVVHVPGTPEDRNKLRIMLDQYSREGKFALF